MLGLADLMPGCWLEVSLHPANSIKDFRGFLGPRANAQLIPKFHFACSPPNGNIKNVALLTLGWITLFMGDKGESALHREERK
jgi:hypothetical protein